MQPIKVLHIVPNMQAGGLETFIMNLMRNIDRSKIQFDFLVHYQSRKFYDDEIEKLGGKIYRFSLREDNNLFHYLYHLNKFFKEHQEYKIIHCHMESIGFLIFFIAKCHGIKVRIAHSHTINTENNLKGKIKYLLSKLIKYTSTDNLACSKQAGEYLFHDKPYQIIPNAIDLSKFSFDQNKRNQIREELKIEQSALVVGHIGRFNLAKNHTKLLDIFFEYQLTNSNSYLLLVGEGEEKKSIEEKCHRLNIENKVKFLSTRKDTDYLYSAFDIFVLPSHFEGLGIVLIEAQSSGLYCYTTAKTVPQEAKITDRLQYLPSTMPANEWASQFIKNNNYNRVNIRFNQNKDNYDIKQTVKKLEKFYLEKINN